MGPSSRFFLSYLASLTILSLSSCLFEVVCLILHVFFFGFVLLLHNAIILSIMLLCFATTPCYYRFTLLLAPRYYCTLLSLHLAIIMSSTLLLLWAPACYCYKLHLATVILPLLLLCLAFCLIALLLNLVASPPLLFLCLFQVPMASPKTLVVALPYCCFTLLLFCLVNTTYFLCFPS